MTTTPEQRTATLSELVAQEIDAVRGRKRWSQAQLARAIGKTEMWVSLRLRGKQEIGMNDLAMIAGALGVGVHDLMPSPEKVRAASRPAGTASGGSNQNDSFRQFALTAEIPPPNGHRLRDRHDRVSPTGAAGGPVAAPRRGSTRPGTPIDPRRRRPMPVAGPVTRPMP